jgi:hypothetical protein
MVDIGAKQSIVVTFGTTTLEEGQILVVELDAEKHIEIYGEEKSTFLYGEKAYFRVYKYPADMPIVIKTSVSSTDPGAIRSEGSGVTGEGGLAASNDTLQFTTTSGVNSVSATKPIKSVVDYEWIGDNLGAIATEGTTVTASKSALGVLDLNYKAAFSLYYLSISTKSQDEFTVIVMVIGG